MKCGLCKWRTTKSITGADRENEADPHEDDKNCRAQRCCVRYNYMQRMRVRRQLVGEIENEEAADNQLEVAELPKAPRPR